MNARREAAAPAGWDATSSAFHACHRRPLNVLLHGLTTPLGSWATLELADAVHPILPTTLALLAVLSLVGRVPRRLWVATAVAWSALAALAAWTALPWTLALGAVVAAWVGQELAHVVTGERTFQSTYQGRRGWLAALADHTLLLLPLVLEALWRVRDPALRAVVARAQVWRATLDAPSERAATATLRAWIDAQAPTREQTTHWWYRELTGEAREAFDHLAEADAIRDAFRRTHGEDRVVSLIRPMNEVYVAGPEKRATSDTVFFMGHVDGPFGALPFASVYRCLVAVSPNRRVRTHFPMLGEAHPLRTLTLDEGQVIGFDYHRELHRIDHDPDVPPSEDLRCTLKLHYVVYPRWAGPWARLVARASTAYNARARALFLETIAPGSPRARSRAGWVLFTTGAFDRLQRTVGARNLTYLAAVGTVSALAGSWVPWLLGTSFVHYLIYIATFRHREDVAFHAFVRDAVFYKAVSTLNLAVAYLSVFVVDPVSLGLLALGYGLGALSTRVLGFERTYFGVELGQVPPARIDAFPYGVVPHPMIVGGIVALLGFQAMPTFAAAWPWLVPAHIGLYVVHLLQEAWAGGPDGGPGS